MKVAGSISAGALSLASDGSKVSSLSVSPPAVYGFPKVDSLRPTLAWEAFPRPADRDRDSAGDLERMSDIRYDLRIRRAEHPLDLVYSVEDLRATSHRVSERLASDTTYRWAVRARFELDGATRVTAWNGLKTGWRSTVVPSPYRFGFRTP